MVSISDNTPANQLPGALAYALPYEGTHIVVFYDRIKSQVDGSMVPRLLAHVLVHEITHILQRVGRHSASGVMKARFNDTDHFKMKGKGLGFTKEDYRLDPYRIQQRKYGDAISEMQTAVKLASQSTETLAGLGLAYAAAGYREAAQSVLNTLDQLGENAMFCPITSLKSMQPREIRRWHFRGWKPPTIKAIRT